MIRLLLCTAILGVLHADTHIPWAVKFPAKNITQGPVDIVCPGGQIECPTGSTCCRSKQYIYTCCPTLHGVCCSDGLHCCPQGYQCDVSRDTCTKSSKEIPDSPDQTLYWDAAQNDQPDITRKCPNGSCEKLNAPSRTMPMVSAFPANQTNHLDKVICPDQKHYCPDGTSCCHFKAQGWGCCIYPKSVCCSDEIHCCPEGHKCAVSRKLCLKVD